MGIVVNQALQETQWVSAPPPLKSENVILTIVKKYVF